MAARVRFEKRNISCFRTNQLTQHCSLARRLPSPRRLQIWTMTTFGRTGRGDRRRFVQASVRATTISVFVIFASVCLWSLGHENTSPKTDYEVVLRETLRSSLPGSKVTTASWRLHAVTSYPHIVLVNCSDWVAVGISNSRTPWGGWRSAEVKTGGRDSGYDVLADVNGLSVWMLLWGCWNGGYS